MRVLLLTSRIPHPLNDGGNIAVSQIMKALLHHNVEVSLLSMNTTKHWVATQDLPPVYQSLKLFKTVKVDNSVRPIPALLHFLKGTSYNIARFVTPDFKNALIEILQQHSFDIIQLEGLFVTPYIDIIRKYAPNTSIAYRQHNVEFQIWERLAAQSKNPLKKYYLKGLAHQLKQYELEYLNKYDILIPISKTDEMHYQSLGYKGISHYYPYCIELNDDQQYKTPKIDANQPIKFYHIGAMDWLPNQEGIDWFLENVWKEIAPKYPHISLHLAGRNMPERYFNLSYPQVEVVGEVANAAAFESDKEVLIVPILAGGGIRIKTLQAMANGKAVMTTQIGIQGIDAQHLQEVLIADNAPAFIHNLEMLIQNPSLIHSLSKKAYQLAHQSFDEAQNTLDLIDCYQKIYIS